MKNYAIAAVVVLAVVVVGIYAYKANNTSYVNALDSEISNLESDLETANSQIVNGSLSVEQAVEVENKIVTRLNGIKAAIEAAENDKSITAEQKLTLIEALNRFKDTLARYQSTLEVVDSTLSSTEQTSRSGSGGNARKSLTDVLEDALDVLETHAEEVIIESEPEEPEGQAEENDQENSDTNDEEFEDQSAEENENTESEPADSEDTSPTTTTEDETRPVE